MLQSIIDALLNTIFVSVPEELVWVVFSLILLKRRDLLDIYFWKENLIQIMIPVLPVAVSINLMRYILHVDNIINFIIIEVMMCSLMCYLIKRNNIVNEKIKYIKIILYVILVDIGMNFVVECLYALLLMTFTHMNILVINNNIFMNITLSLFPRAIQIIIISFYLYKKNIESDIKFLELILRDKVLSISLIGFIAALITVIYFITRVILENDILLRYAIVYQVIMNILIILIPIILIISFITPIYHLLAKNIKDKKTVENMFDDNF